jgi:hypothetical protein
MWMEYLKDWEGGDKDIDMKDASLPIIVSCQPDQDMMFLKETHFPLFFWITQYSF